MATPFNLTFADISLRVMNNLRLPVTNLIEQAKVNALINEVYRDIYVKHDWWWLVKHVVINTGPKINSGTVSLTQNNTTINFTDVPMQFGSNVTIAGYAMKIPGNSDDANAVYRISGHTAPATVAVLDGAYTGETNAAAGFNVYQDRYALPVDLGKLLGVTRYGAVRPLDRWGIEKMQMEKQVDSTENRPMAYTIYDFVTTGDPTTQRLMWVHPYPDKAYRMDVYYKQELNTEMACSDQGYMPDEYRQLLVYGALARGYPIFHKDKERGQFFQSLFNDALALMVAQHKEYAADLAAVAPAPGYRRASRRGLTNFTLGSWFDTLPSQP
jgi:hypothetical protein